MAVQFQVCHHLPCRQPDTLLTILIHPQTPPDRSCCHRLALASPVTFCSLLCSGCTNLLCVSDGSSRYTLSSTPTHKQCAPTEHRRQKMFCSSPTLVFTSIRSLVAFLDLRAPSSFVMCEPTQCQCVYVLIPWDQVRRPCSICLPEKAAAFGGN